jgi:hypothetical protein
LPEWHQEEIQKLDRKTRQMLTIQGQHHPKSDIDRLYVPKKDGGSGLMQIERAYITEVIKLKEYVEHTDDPLMQIVRTHQHNTTRTDSIKDLGVFIDSKLHFHNHVDYIFSQCIKLLGLVRAITFPFSSIGSLHVILYIN